jgi:predicted transcriptional regulator
MQKNLTKAELQLMNILWDKGEATVSELIEVMGDAEPAYTTLLTLMQVLTRKDVVHPERSSKCHVYHALLSREDYINSLMHETSESLFHGSVRSFFSYFVKSEKLSKEELQKILDEMSEE